jgi:regulator of protease activity HflC (stomatin/prohibitin superfamily)
MANITKKAALTLITIFVSILIVFSSFYTVDQKERGVILRNGAVIGDAEPGLRFKFPIIDRVVFISMQNEKAEFEKMTSYSKDQQPAEMRISVNYHASPSQAKDIYASYGSLEGMVDRLLRPSVNSATKEVFGQYTAAAVIQDRSKFGADVYQAIIETVGDKLAIDSVQVENIDFSDAYEQSVEQRMLAEVEVQKVRQNWEKEKVSADITRTQAQAEADARLAQATAEAKSIELKGAAEATAIQSKGQALRDNPLLIGLIQAEKWNGQLPTTMIPGSTVPFIEVK